jgi:hypothetical protein
MRIKHIFILFPIITFIGNSEGIQILRCLIFVPIEVINIA